MSADFDRSLAHVKATMLAGGLVPPMLMAYTADAVMAIPLATVIGKDGAIAIADMIEIFFLTHGVSRYMVTFEAAPGEATQAFIVAEVVRGGRVVHKVQKLRDGTVTLSADVAPAILAEKILALLPTDDFTAEEELVDVAEWMVTSLGLRKMPR